jgi:putative peptide zinc metalloprotease protein
MSLEAVQRIIARAVTDSSFRDLLKSSPNEVLAGQEVTPEELQTLSTMDWEAVGSEARDLDARISHMAAVLSDREKSEPPVAERSKRGTVGLSHLEDHLQVDSVHPPGRTKSVWDRLRLAVDVAEYRPRLRDGLIWRKLTTAGGEDYIIIQNPEAATYLRLPPEDFFVFQLMDGTLTIRDLVVAYMLKFQKFALPRVARLVHDLRYNQFLVDPPYFTYQQLGRLARPASIGSFADNLLNLTLKREFAIKGIDGFLQRAYRGGVWMLFTRPVQLVMALVAFAGVPLFLYYLLSQQFSLLPSESIAQNVIGYYVSFLIVTIVHELSHAFTVNAHGRVIRRGGFGFLYGLRGLFVDTQDIWMEPRGPRIATSWAGPYSGLILTGLVGVALTIAPHASWSPLVRLFGIAALVNNLFQLMPLIQLDGYFILMDWLEIPQLRRKALVFVRHDLLSKLKRRQPFSREERIFAVFGVLAGLYTVFAISLASVFWWNHASSAIQTALRVPNLASLLGAAVIVLVLVVFVIGVLRRIAALAQTLVRALGRATGLARERWTRERVAVITQTLALAGLSKDQAGSVARYLHEERFDPGAAVVRQGEPGDRFYLIADGQAEVLREGPDHAELLATLGRMDYFGERALLENVPRSATVRAQTRLRVFSLNGPEFRKSLAPYVGAEATLRARLSEREDLDRFGLFESLGGRGKDLLLARLQLESYRPGQAIIHEGDPGDEFYCIRSGRVELTRRGEDGGGIRVASLGPGEFFGEVALLLKTPRNATATAVEPVQVWTLTQSDFHDLLGHYFNLEASLAEVARERSLAGQLVLESSLPGTPISSANGEIAPDFHLQAVDGPMFGLAELRGNRVLLWFSLGWTEPACRDYSAQLDAVAADRVVIVQITPESVGETRTLQPAGVRHLVVCDPTRRAYSRYGLYTATSADQTADSWWAALQTINGDQLAPSTIGHIREGIVLIRADGSISARRVAAPSTPLPSPEVILHRAPAGVP